MNACRVVGSSRPLAGALRVGATRLLLRAALALLALLALVGLVGLLGVLALGGLLCLWLRRRGRHRYVADPDDRRRGDGRRVRAARGGVTAAGRVGVGVALRRAI